MSLSKATLIPELFQNEIFNIKEITLKGGSKSPYYVDLHRLISYPDLMHKICTCITNKIKGYDDLEYTKIAGVPYGGIPFAVNISQQMNLPMLLPRKKKKEYGMKKEIEGAIEIGDEVILIEDTVTTGASTLETIKMLERNGCLISLVLIVVDREEGGYEFLQESGYDTVRLYKTTEIVEQLQNRQLLDAFQYESVSNYVNAQKKKFMKKLANIDGDDKGSDNGKDTKNETDVNDENKYNPILKHQLASFMLSEMITKKTALCLSLDTSTWEAAKKLIHQCGEYIIMVKTHVELYQDYNDNFESEIKELAKQYHFFIMEDRKLSDVAKISYRQTTSGNYNISNWANFVTVHGLNADSYLNMMKQHYGTKDCINYCPVIVSQMNDNLCMIGEEYTQKCLDVIDKYPQFSPLIVCQSLPKRKDIIKCTPGVVLTTQEEDSDVDLCRYRNVEKAIQVDGNHIVIVGSSIIYDENPKEAAQKFQVESWKVFEESYPSLIQDTQKYFTDFAQYVAKKKEYFENIENKEKVEKVEKEEDKKEVEESS
jgi:uridine monophosphate synthetase